MFCSKFFGQANGAKKTAPTQQTKLSFSTRAKVEIKAADAEVEDGASTEGEVKQEKEVSGAEEEVEAEKGKGLLSEGKESKLADGIGMVQTTGRREDGPPSRLRQRRSQNRLLRMKMQRLRHPPANGRGRPGR